MNNLETLNSVAENQRNTSLLETQTPQEEIKHADRPRYDVPIMIEITQQDLDLAHEYTSCDKCLIATALSRRGYNVYSVNPNRVQFGDYPNFVRFYSDDIAADKLTINLKYRPEVVGKQIILYPENK